MKSIEVDVLVCGAGMSGLACAAFAASAGARVLVVEKQATVGGSSNYSAGMFWGPRNYESLRAWVPEGDPALQKAWLADYLRAVQWMRVNGVPTSQRFDGIMTIGSIGFPINIPHLHRYHQQRIRDSHTQSRILTNTSVVQLLQEQPGVAGSRLVGAIIRTTGPRDEDAQYCTVTAKMVVLATGGFQGSAQLTSTHLGPGGDNIFVRSNKGSVGDGLALASAAGAGTSRGMGTYYGHLLAAPLRAEDVDPKEFLALAQYQSKYCLLINRGGRRFVDESIGDEIVNQYLAKQEGRRGFLLFNEQTRLQHCVSALFPNAGDIDRLQKARDHGCNVTSATSIADLVSKLEEWGVDGIQARRTLENYDSRIRLGKREVSLDAPTGTAGAASRPLTDGEGPFYAMEVQPSITFTYGGVQIDTRGRALSADRTAIPGLLIAGVDAGGFSNRGYAGGLALAFVTGFWAAREVARTLGLPEPELPAAAAEDTPDERAWRKSSRL
ncbi:hypothetical protein ASPACDRAFT_1868574 [Aspergillus aculeatus ATCC 16872]|uniref:FAD-dependent oxidoreductase 2 FAD-binding domain-containing protein n=1 Tax=Aspergillus aculeatus (strain ATCC 16872 / CBS 172.66 / WB 5094) TaxID=690307 RepID=A0A1L9WVQ9_ASPA1|nr:uncharacterized protein ASPACDRAFT_1868574 [Aspergillus aculeatus ATCC 16872]OJK00106.1 hypothetical protein ASPACDRAFT_1868574 [Aspergillus aculeatus ATCC 16872]